MSWRLALLLVACLAVAGCADNNKSSEDNRFAGFYGGVSGGVAP